MYLQDLPICSPEGLACHSKLSALSLGCPAACSGLYADVRCSPDPSIMKDHKLMGLQRKYNLYKTSFAENVVFNMDEEQGSKLSCFFCVFSSFFPQFNYCPKTSSWSRLTLDLRPMTMS